MSTNQQPFESPVLLQHYLRRASELSQTGTFLIDLGRRTIFVSEEMARLLGTGDEAFELPLDEYRRRFYHPADQQPSVAKAEASYATGGVFQLETRVIRADGQEIWVRSCSRVETDERGERVVVGVMQDITESVRTRARLERQSLLLERLTERLQLATSAADIGIWDWDVVTNALVWDETMCRLYGIGLRDAPGQYGDWLSMLSESHRARVAERIRAALGGEPFVDDEFEVERPDGSRHVLRAAWRVVRDEQGAPLRMVGVNYDVTARRRAEQSLTASAGLLRQLIKHTPAAVAMFDTDMRYIAVSDRWLTDYHLEGQEILGRSHYEVFPDIPERWKAVHRRVLAGATETCDEDPFERADGTIEWLQWSVRPWLTGDGRVGGVTMLTQVITDRKRAEELLRDSETRFRALSEDAHVGIYIIEEGQVTYANPALEAMFGRPAADLLGRRWFEHVHPDDRDRVARHVEGRLAGDLSRVQYEMRIIQANGATALLDVRSSVASIGGRPTIVGNVMDVTERKRAEQLLYESEQRFRTLIEKAPIAIGVSRGGYALWGNERFRALWGYRAEDLEGRALSEMWAPERGPSVMARAKLLTPGTAPSSFEAMARRKDGSLFPAHATAVAVDLPEGRTSIGFFTDETERKRAEDALRDSERRFRELAENIDEVFWVLDPHDVTLQYVSPAYERVFGRPAKHGPWCDVWLDAVHPDDRERVRSAAGRYWRDWEETYRIRRPDLSVRWIHERAFPLLDDGVVYRVVGTAMDITEQRDLELQMRHAQKMEAIGVLAGGVAHDFNNMLSVILSYSSLLLEELSQPDPMRADILEMKNAAERAAALTQQLLVFSRRKPSQARLVDLNEVLASTEKMLRRVIGEDVVLQTGFAAAGAPVVVDGGQIEQVLMNLAVNARDAMPDGGALTIEIGRVEALPLDAPMGLPPRPYVTLSVTDTGVGMDAATRARIFEPFFTTKEAGKGTGLGLSTVFGIIRQSGGHIEVDSEVGKGCTLRIWLPVAVEEVVDVPMSTREEELGGVETVLIVEDEEAVRRLARNILTKRGYRVLEAASAGDAILICEKEATRIDLVLTDVVMPLMRGEVLASRLAALRPGLRVVFMSGYPDHGAQLGSSSPAVWIEKPFTPGTLLRGVRAALSLTSPA